MIEANSLFPLQDPNSVVLQYAVPDDIIDIGVPPTRIVTQRFSTFCSLDLALLHVTGDIPAHRNIRLASQAPEVGEEVSLLGKNHGIWFDYKKTRSRLTLFYERSRYYSFAF